MHELEIRLVDGDEMNFDQPFLPFKEKKCMRRVLHYLTLNEEY